MPSIHFLDVTNRDGVQTARTGLSKFGKLRLSGWCRAVPADVEAAVAVRAGGSEGAGLRHYNLSISTSDQMIAHKFRGKMDRAAIIKEMTAAVAVAKAGLRRAGGAPGERRAGGAQEEYSIGVNAEDGSRTDDGYLLEFALAAKEAGATRVRYCDTIGGDSPGRIRERFGKLAAAAGLPVETHCHNDLGMAVANSVSGALGDLDAGQDAWINTCVNGIGERAGNADLLSCILAFRYGFGVSEVTGPAAIGDPIDLSWARRFGLWAAYAFGQPLPPAWAG